MNVRPLATLALAAGILAGCSAAPPASFDPADCAHADANGVVNLGAEAMAFDAACITVPANQAFTIHFSNRDDVQHNVAIYESAAKATEFLLGDVIDAGDTIDYEVEALPAGDYFFDCTVHPVMNGPLFVLPSD